MRVSKRDLVCKRTIIITITTIEHNKTCIGIKFHDICYVVLASKRNKQTYFTFTFIII